MSFSSPAVWSKSEHCGAGLSIRMEGGLPNKNQLNEQDNHCSLWVCFVPVP